jgi:hypothetical protein
MNEARGQGKVTLGVNLERLCLLRLTPLALVRQTLLGLVHLDTNVTILLTIDLSRARHDLRIAMNPLVYLWTVTLHYILLMDLQAGIPLDGKIVETIHHPDTSGTDSHLDTAMRRLLPILGMILFPVEPGIMMNVADSHPNASLLGTHRTLRVRQ